MARVLLILSIVLTLVAAGLGFVAKQKVDGLNTAIQERTSQLNQTKTKLKKTEDDLAATKKELETTKQQLEETTTQLTKTKGELDDATKKLADSTTALDAANAKIKELEEIVKVDPTIGESLKQQLERMKAEEAKAQAELAESKQVQETLTQKLKEAEDNYNKAQQTVRDYQYHTVKPGLSGKVLAFNPGWNFVVINIGDKMGLKAGVNMIVQRGNTMIAKVKVSSVEPNTAIADVLGGSMRGAKVEPGDTVIYEGER